MPDLQDNPLTTASTAPVPQSVVQPTPAPGLQGPKGLSPRQNYSRVNTGLPPEPDAGGLQQKSIMPAKVGSAMSNQFSSATRPRALNDMLKTAMESTLSRSKIASEARRQLENLESNDFGEKTAAAEKCKKCGKGIEKCSCGDKCGSALPTEHVLKLAAATDYVVELLKQSADLAGPYKLTENTVAPGIGPGALTVTQTEPSGPPHVIHTNSGQAVAGDIPPRNPALRKAMSQEHSATQLENDYDRAPGTGDAPVSGSTKNAAPVNLLRKLARGPSPEELAALAQEQEAANAQEPVQPGMLQRLGNFMGRHDVAASTLGGAGFGSIAGGMSGATLGNILELSPGRRLALAAMGSGIGAIGGGITGAIGAPIVRGNLQGMLGAATPYPNGAAGGMLPASSKLSSAPISLLRKLAEDAINPAQISAGQAQPPVVSVAGEAGPASSGKERVPDGYKAVAGYTRRDAKSVPKSEMGALLDEPMDSAAHDNILQQVFTHTGEAGAKISSAQNTKLAAAKALLANLANGGV